MTVDPLKIGFTAVEFDAYAQANAGRTFKDTGGVVAGCVLHNTFLPDLKMVQGYLSTKKWTQGQLIENWWTQYRQKAWRSGPHIFIFPDKIYVATPLTLRGTHSPSFNSQYWGIEIVGDYSHEILPQSMRALTVSALASLFKKLGRPATAENFRFHGEDPKTTHRLCPGKNVGPKADWIAAINAAINPATPKVTPHG